MLRLVECATCHIYVPAGFPSAGPSGDEEDMLGYAIGFKAGISRLGCQIQITPEVKEWAKAGGVIDLPRF
jgi:ferredoxin